MRKRLLARSVYCLMILCLVVSPIASAAYTISGSCYGFYYYGNADSGQFTGVIQQQGTKIWGSFSEPRTTFGPHEAELSSKFSGEINDVSVVFTKTYTYDPNHQVVYRGTYYPNERKIKGNWYIGKTSGQFDITLQ